MSLLPIAFYAWLKFTSFRPLGFLPDYPAPPEFFVAAVCGEFYLCYTLLRFIDQTHRDYNAQLEDLVNQLRREKQKTLEQQDKVVLSSKMAALGEMAAGGADFAEITVLDNGAGVPAELRHKIFEPFFTTKPVGRGTGLGLSLSQGLMRSQHGKLELRPSASGACFVVSLTKIHLPTG